MGGGEDQFEEGDFGLVASDEHHDEGADAEEELEEDGVSETHANFFQKGMISFVGDHAEGGSGGVSGNDEGHEDMEEEDGMFYRFGNVHGEFRVDGVAIHGAEHELDQEEDDEGGGDSVVFGGGWMGNGGGIGAPGSGDEGGGEDDGGEDHLGEYAVQPGEDDAVFGDAGAAEDALDDDGEDDDDAQSFYPFPCFGAVEVDGEDDDGEADEQPPEAVKMFGVDARVRLHFGQGVEHHGVVEGSEPVGDGHACFEAGDDAAGDEEGKGGGGDDEGKGGGPDDGFFFRGLPE